MMLRSLYSLLLVPCALAAQRPTPILLKAANGTLRDPMAVGQVRELRDGRVLVAGPIGVVVADFATGTVHVIRDVPRGTLMALGGDSTMVEVRTTGWFFLDADKLLGMLPLSNKVVAAVPGAQTSGVDGSGLVLAVTGGQPASDSASVIEINRTTADQSVVTRVWQGTPVMGGVPAPVFVVNEEPVLARDGWIAVVRAHPYRVDWRTPAGQWVRGAAIPGQSVPMDAREQAAYWKHWEMDPPNASVHIEWPKWVEPFTHPMPIAAPDAKVVVRRTPTADAPGVRYDVVNHRGEIEGQITLAGPHDQIAGFGAHSIYVLVIDAATPRNMQLERRPWP